MSTAPAMVEPSRARRVWGWIRWSVLVLTCVLLAVYVTYRVWMEIVAAQGRAELTRAIEETDAASPGWRWDEILAARKPVPPGLDSWPVIDAVYEAGAVLLPRNQMADEPAWADANAPNRLLPDNSIAWLQRRPGAIAACLDLVAVMQDRRSDYLPESLWENLDIGGRLGDWPDGVPVSAASAAILRWVFEAAVNEDQVEIAGRCLRAMLRMGAAHRDDPNYRGFRVRISIRRQTVTSVERLLAMTQPDAATLLGLQTLLEAERREEFAGAMVRGERAQWFRFLEDLRTGQRSLAVHLQRGMPENWLLVRMLAHHQSFLLPAEEVQTLRAFQQAEAITQRPIDEQLPEWDRLNRQRWEAWPQELSIQLSGRVRDLLKRCSQDLLEDQTRLTLAGTALACERFRREKQRWPRTLEEFVPAYLPAVPRNAWNQPLRLTVRPDGLRIESPTEIEGTEFHRHQSEPLTIGLWNPDQRRQPSGPAGGRNP